MTMLGKWKFGDEVWEIYILHKKYRTGRKFGFVKFLNVPNPSLLEQQLDKLSIGGAEFECELPKICKGK